MIFIFFVFSSLFGEGFSPDTLVLVPGNKHVRIDSLKPGEYVLSQDEQGKTVENRILAVRKQRIDSYEEVKFPKWYFFSSTLKTASNQKFQSPTDHNWQTILENGSDNKNLCCKDAKTVAISDRKTIQKEEEFIDLAFAKHHNFYVTENNILTHNFAFFIVLAFEFSTLAEMVYVGMSLGIVAAGLCFEFAKDSFDRCRISAGTEKTGPLISLTEQNFGSQLSPEQIEQRIKEWHEAQNLQNKQRQITELKINPFDAYNQTQKIYVLESNSEKVDPQAAAKAQPVKTSDLIPFKIADQTIIMHKDDLEKAINQAAEKLQTDHPDYPLIAEKEQPELVKNYKLNVPDQAIFTPSEPKSNIEWKITECTAAFVCNTVQGAKAGAGDMAKNPEHVVVNLAAGPCVFALQVVSVAYNMSRIGIIALVDSKLAKEELDTYLSPVYEIKKSFENKSMPEKAAALGYLIGYFGAQHKIYGKLGELCNSVKVSLFNKKQDLVPVNGVKCNNQNKSPLKLKDFSESNSLLNKVRINGIKAIEDLIQKFTFVEKNIRGKESCIQFEKIGTYEDALNDFYMMGLKNIREMGRGKIGMVGELSDGRMVNVRPGSTYLENISPEKIPTLEIFDPKKIDLAIKFRYIQ